MSWWKKLFGIKTPKQKMMDEIDQLQKLAFEAQRNGDLSLSGQYLLEVEKLYDKIKDMDSTHEPEDKTKKT